MLRRSARWAGLLVSVLLALPLTAGAASGVSSSNLRPQSVRIAECVARGIERSATFRALVERIDQGDVVVYIDAPIGMSHGLSASLTWMAVIPGARLVRVSLRHDLGNHDAVAMLAHELRHVVELLDHPEVRSEIGLGDLYRRIGRASTAAARHWDTTAALRAGRAVRLELLG
jgi:hypothetical protein